MANRFGNVDFGQIDLGAAVADAEAAQAAQAQAVLGKFIVVGRSFIAAVDDQTEDAALVLMAFAAQNPGDARVLVQLAQSAREAGSLQDAFAAYQGQIEELTAEVQRLGRDNAVLRQEANDGRDARERGGRNRNPGGGNPGEGGNGTTATPVVVTGPPTAPPPGAPAPARPGRGARVRGVLTGRPATP